MKRRFLTLLLILGAALALSMSAHAEVLEIEAGYDPRAFFTAAQDGDTIRLMADCDSYDTLEVRENRSVTLDLNGHVLRYTGGGGSVIIVNSGSTLTIVDSDPNAQHRFNGDQPLWRLDDSGTEIVYGGVITGGTGRGELWGNATSIGGGGGVFVRIGGRLQFESGNIVGCSANDLGSAVCLDGHRPTEGGEHVGSSMTMGSGARIAGCFIRNAEGGAIFINYSTLDMTGGTIEHCSGGAEGGGVYVDRFGSRFTMSGGVIRDCSASDLGGGVYVTRGALFEMSGSAQILRCSVGENGRGGGVYLAGSSDMGIRFPTFTMTGGEIGDCGDSRSLVVCADTTMNAEGGTVAGRVLNRGTITAAAQPGTAFTGTVRNESSNQYGDQGRILGGDFSQATVEGTVNITLDPGNGESPTIQEIPWTQEGYPIPQPAQPTNGDLILAGWFDGEREWDFAADRARRTTLLTAQWTDHQHCLCGGADTGEDHTHTALPWLPWTAADTLPTAAGRYYLTQNVVLSAAQTIPADVMICLNGKTVSAAPENTLEFGEGLLQLTGESPASLILTDCRGTGLVDGAGTASGTALRLYEKNTAALHGQAAVKGEVLLTGSAAFSMADDSAIVGGLTACDSSQVNMSGRSVIRLRDNDWLLGLRIQGNAGMTMGDHSRVRCAVVLTENGSLTLGDDAQILAEPFELVSGIITETDVTCKNNARLELGGRSKLAAELQIWEVQEDQAVRIVFRDEGVLEEDLVIGHVMVPHDGSPALIFQGNGRITGSLQAKDEPLAFPMEVESTLSVGGNIELWDKELSGKLVSAGEIQSGIFHGDVENNGTITGGIFYGTVTGTGTIADSAKVTLTFDAQGGTPVDGQRILRGQKAQMPQPPTRDHDRFEGWMLENAPYDFSRPVVEGLTLTARWTAARSISYVLDGGVNAPENPDWYLPGEGVPQLGAPTRDMADFSGWYRDAAFTQGPVTSIGPAEDGDITLFAKWTLRSTAITPVGPKPAEPLPDAPQTPFTDIPTGSWCEDAVAWAAEKGIAQGVGGGLFGPELPCTRGQIVTFLWRAAGSPQPAALSAFADVPSDSYCAKAVAWAVEKGITTGTGDGRFSPEAPCTRAQAAAFLYRWEQSRGGGFTGAWMFRLPFADVPEWAYEAIAWCSMKGITQGTGETTFSPDLPCTRGQIVTFLYRMENVDK